MLLDRGADYVGGTTHLGGSGGMLPQEMFSLYVSFEMSPGAF